MGYDHRNKLNSPIKIHYDLPTFRLRHRLLPPLYPHELYGEPDYDDLNRLRNQFKANLTSVTSDLGGGNHGHLVLGLTVVHYNSISNTAYIRMAHTGVVELVGATQYETVILRNDWKRALELYKETDLVEKAIENQIIEANDERYVKTLVDRTTRTIQRIIPKILNFLFVDRYGQIEDEDLREKEEENKELRYELVDPIVNVFNEIEDLRDLGVAADNEYSEQNFLKFGLSIIKNTG